MKHTKRKRLYYLLAVISLFFAQQAQSQKLERKYIREGNEYYAAKEYGNAEVAYNNALDENEKSYAASFNLGDAYYRQMKTDKAIELFSNLITVTANKENLADLYYNLGTIKLSDAIQNIAIKDYEPALEQLKEAIDYYKNSLKNNPKDRHTKYNLSLAQQLKKDLEKIQQDDPNKGDGDNNNDNNNNDKNNDKNDNKDNKNDNKDKNNEADADQDGIPDRVEKGDKPNNPTDTDNDGTPDYQDLDSDNDGKPDEQEAGNKPSEPKDTDKDGTPDYRDLDSDNDGIPDSEEKDGAPKNQQISMEDALRWLENIENEEKRVQEKVKKAKAKKTKASKIKNW